MPALRALQGTPGRVGRAAVGVMLIGVGAAAGGGWWAMAVVGLVPLMAAVGNVCLFAPLFHQPLRAAGRSGPAR